MNKETINITITKENEFLVAVIKFSNRHEYATQGKTYLELYKNINDLLLKENKEICKCGHHTRDHSYLPDWSGNLHCDICDCKDFEVRK